MSGFHFSQYNCYKKIPWALKFGRFSKKWYPKQTSFGYRIFLNSSKVKKNTSYPTGTYTWTDPIYLKRRLDLIPPIPPRLWSVMSNFQISAIHSFLKEPIRAIQRWKMWKSPTRRLKRCSWGRERNLEKNTKLKPWGNQFNLKAKEAIQSIKRIGDCHKNSKRNATKIPETGTRVSAHRCWLDAEALLWLTAAGAVSAIATGGEREGGCRGWKQSPDGWGD